jgi:predicted ABC-type ATPase
MQEIIVVGGANGTGKTTFSKQIIAETGYPFLNADEIEKELNIGKVQAGKEFFRRWEAWTAQQASFVVESTLSGGYLVKYLKQAQQTGYTIKMVYVFLENPAQCLHRIKIRVSLGGHNIPEEDVIRRFYRSKANFWYLYKCFAKEWVLFYNATTENSQKIAVGNQHDYTVENRALLETFLQDQHLWK